MRENDLTIYEDVLKACKDSLRPTFTALIVKSLLKGKSVNLIGEDGSGRERLLKDCLGCIAKNSSGRRKSEKLPIFL